MSNLDKFLEVPRRVDRWLKKVIGQENDLLYHFVRLLLIAIVFALVVAVVVEIVWLIWRAMSLAFSAFIVALPYLLAAAIIAGVAALTVYVRRKRSKRPQRAETPGEAAGAIAPQKLSPASPQTRPPDDDPGISRSLLSADQPTRGALQAVLTSLQRFDHRLELVITQVHYTDLFGDNWAVVRQFVESPQGRGMTEVSAALLEIIILYKRAAGGPLGTDQPRPHPRLVDGGRPPAEMAVGIVRVHGRSIRPGCSRGFPSERRAFAGGTSKTCRSDARCPAHSRRPAAILRADETRGVGV